MRRRCRLEVAIFPALLIAALCHAADLRIVENARPAAAIVISARAPETVKFAAKELADHIEKCTGARLSIVTDAQNPRGNLILVGRSRLTQSLRGDLASLDEDGFIIRRQGSHVLIVGSDEDGDPVSGSGKAGTLFGAYEFLERVAGVRWLGPGDLWTVTPKRASLSVGDLDATGKPLFVTRVIGFHGTNRLPRKERHEIRLWLRRMRNRKRLFGFWGHSFGWADLKNHPEWRSVHKGKRNGMAQPCYHEPSFLEESQRQVLRRLKANRITSVAPKDGGFKGFCDQTCPHCSKHDDGRFKARDLSQRIFKMVGVLAAHVKDKHPGRFVGTYAYSCYHGTPKSFRLPDNVYVFKSSWTPNLAKAEVPESVRSWTRAHGHVGIADHLTAYDGHPYFYPRHLAAQIRLFAEAGIRWYQAESQANWAGEGLNYYVGAKMLWDPKADVGHIISDYCRSGFGPAAAAVEKYFRAVESLPRTPAWEKAEPRAEKLRKIVDSPAFASAERALQEALPLAPDEMVERRIRFLQLSPALTRLNVQGARAARAYAKSRKPEGFEALVKIVRDRRNLPAGVDAVCAFTPYALSQRWFPEFSLVEKDIESTREHFTGDPFINFDRFRRRAVEIKNLRFLHKKSRMRSYLIARRKSQDAYAVWEVRRAKPIRSAAVGYYVLTTPKPGVFVAFLVSVDGGKSWQEVFRRAAKSNKGADRYHGGSIDLTKLVKGRTAFLLKYYIPAAAATSSNRLFHVTVNTKPE